MTASPFDHHTLRRAFAAFPSGVTAVCGVVDGVPVGMAASSFTSVSLDPPLASVAIGRHSRSWRLLRKAPRLGVSVLAEGQVQACRALGSSSPDKFAGIPWTAEESGALFVLGSCLRLECSRYAEVPAGDHDIVLLRIEELRGGGSGEPLVFHDSRFRRLLDRRDPAAA